MKDIHVCGREYAKFILHSYLQLPLRHTARANFVVPIA